MGGSNAPAPTEPETGTMIEYATDAGHPTDDDLAAYLDRRLEAPERDRLESHLSWCPDCRAQLTAASAVIRRRAAVRKRWATLAPLAAAAAAIVLLVVSPEGWPGGGGAPAHRDAPSTSATAPIPITPRGAVTATAALVWHRLERAERYRGTLFDASGVVIWRAETGDTVITLPDSVRLEPGATYLWRVDARVGIDRWVQSDMLQFTVAREGGSPER
jgi:hypothetical protein